MPFSRLLDRIAALFAVLIALPYAPVALAADATAPAVPHCPEEMLWQTQPRAQRAPVRASDPIDVTSDTAHFDIAGDATVGGQVQIRQADRLLAADQVHVDKQTNGVDVQGHVSYQDPELVVRGEAGRYQAGAAQFENAQFQLLQVPSRGDARSLALDTNGTLHLNEVTYTTCPPERTDWQIQASAVTIDSAHESGVARNAKIEFQGIPIFYLPWLSFPVGSARQSGFLFPSIGNSSRGGLQVQVPYYLNLAPNFDLTVDPTYYSRRGVDLSEDFRFLTQSSRGIFDANVLEHDQVADRERSRLRLEDVTQIADNWRLTVHAENVSDAGYFEDFAQGTNGTSITFLQRVMELSYRDDNWRAGAQLQNFQTLDTELATVNRPYTELPRLYAEGSWGRAGAIPASWGMDAEAIDFQRGIGVQGWRADLQPHAEILWDGPGYFLHPGVAFRSTVYDLTDTATGQPATPTRNLPIASVDAGLKFEREAAGGSGRVTLEPRLMYLYVPYRNQDALPVFDTGLPDLNWVELFRTNRYVGADRMGDANQVSAGITSNVYSSTTGMRFLSATLGETVYFTQPKVLLPDEVPSGHTSSSDVIAQVALQAYANWNVETGVQWDHQDSRIQKSEVQVQYRPAGTSVVNFGYRYQRDLLEQADISGAWPVSGQWSLYARMLYSLRDHNAIDEFAGVQYSSCCWGVRAVARHYVSTRTGERDTGIYVQLELKGLSNVGTASDAFLEQGIRGYSPPAQKH